MKTKHTNINLRRYPAGAGQSSIQYVRQLFFTLGLGLGICMSGFCQPSSSSAFVFKWVEENGKPISPQAFCQTYRILSVYQTEISACSPSDHVNRLEYDSLQGLYFFYLHTIGPRFSFSLIRGHDTMQIVLPGSLKTGLYFPGLSFRKGNYYLNPFDPGQKKPADAVLLRSRSFVTITEINWKKAAKKYRKSRYNQQ